MWRCGSTRNPAKEATWEVASQNILLNLHPYSDGSMVSSILLVYSTHLFFRKSRFSSGKYPCSVANIQCVSASIFFSSPGWFTE